MIINKKEYLKMFIDDELNEQIKSSNLKVIIQDDIINLINYNTKISYKKINDKKVFVNSRYYSRTTSTNTNEIKRQAEQKGLEVVEYNEQ